MKIATETFHGPNRLTVVAGESFADDADIVKRYPGKFVDPEVFAARRRVRSHSATIQTATARPGEQSAARAVEPRKKKAAENAPEGEGEG